MNLLIIIIILKTKRNNKKTLEKRYIYNLKRIFKYYNNLIVNVINEPNLDNLKILKVSKLEDLIDVAEQTQSNIIYYEVIPNEKSNFYVFIDKYVFIYTLIIDN